MSTTLPMVVHVPEFQGYISPEVEDAIKNDFGGDCILDFLKNKFLMIKAKTNGKVIYLSHSYQTIMDAIERGAFVVANFGYEWYMLNCVEYGVIYFQTIRFGSLTSEKNLEARIALIDSNNRIQFFAVDLGEAIEEE